MRYSLESRSLEDFTVYELKDEKKCASVGIVPELGNTCISYRQKIGDEYMDLIDSPPSISFIKEKPSSYGIPILFPFPNRVRNGRYSFGGKSYEFEEKRKGKNSIHGFVYTRPWTVASETVSEDKASVTSSITSGDFQGLENQYPYGFKLDVKYELSDEGLEFSAFVENTGDSDMPMGLGIHPYFKAPFFKSSETADYEITVPAKKYWELDGESIPTGRLKDADGQFNVRDGKSLTDMNFDHVFTVVNGAGAKCLIDDREKRVRLIIKSDKNFREIVIFNPPERDAIAIEPYTCTTDAINLQPQRIDAGLKVLKPGEVFQGKISFNVESY